MTIIEALILGVVQGITEFLPVSSSGHLVLLQEIFGIKEPALLFDTLVHVGTLAAVCAVLWKDIWNILRKPSQPLTFFLVVATIPAVIAALVFKNSIKAAFASTAFLGFAFLITAALLALSEMLYRRKVKTDKADSNGTDSKNSARDSMTIPDALIIGTLQAVAVIPGISRSGATLAGGLFRRFERVIIVKFSFLLSIPAILGALVFQIKDLASVSGADAFANTFAGIGVVPLIVGTVAAAVVGFFSVRLMLKIVRERSLMGFALYTGILGVLVLIDRFGTHLFI